MRKKLLAVLVLFSVVLSLVGVFAGCSPFSEIERYTVGDGANLKVGVLSDSQLPQNGSTDSSQIKTLEIALNTMKDKKIEALVFAGDFTDLASKDAWQSFKTVYDRVFDANSIQPIKNFVMGNHDYWLDMFSRSKEIPTIGKMRKRFTEYTGEKPFSHKVINGFHFINWSSEDGTYDKSYSEKKWLRKQLDAAVAEDNTKPIFVTTHLNPQDTVYGSQEWGNSDIDDVLKDYPQVISMSGHTHYSLLDERSIYQENYTAINTQALDYICADEDTFNYTNDAYGNDLATSNPIGLILNIDNNKVVIDRIDAKTGKTVKSSWTVSAPFNTKDNFEYSNSKRADTIPVPSFADVTTYEFLQGVGKDNKAISLLTFDSALSQDIVFGYNVQFLNAEGKSIMFDEVDYNSAVVKYDKNGKKLKLDSKEYASGNTRQISQINYLGEFYTGITSPRTTIRLPKTLPVGTVSVKIVAINSFGKESAAKIFAV